MRPSSSRLFPRCSGVARTLRAGRFAVSVCVLALSLCWPALAVEAAKPVTVFAAASLKESMDEAATAYRDATGQIVRVSYASSASLARQIEHGAPADVFVSADLDWMDYLQQRDLIDPRSRRDLFGNRLVLVAPRNSSAAPFVLRSDTKLAPLLGEEGRLAVALTDSVPAGKYARAALGALGLWPALQSRLAQAENVRAALMLVARGEAPLGIVYATDALAEPGVRVLATFPAGSHPAIVYPIAQVAASHDPHAAVFLHWLGGAEAAEIFRRHGFDMLDASSGH